MLRLLMNIKTERRKRVTTIVGPVATPFPELSERKTLTHAPMREPTHPIKKLVTRHISKLLVNLLARVHGIMKNAIKTIAPTDGSATRDTLKVRNIIIEEVNNGLGPTDEKNSSSKQKTLSLSFQTKTHTKVISTTMMLA